MAAEKLSVSLDSDHVRWLRAEAKRRRTTLSAVLAEAVADERRAHAREKLLSRLGGRLKLGPEDVARIHAEWRGD